VIFWSKCSAMAVGLATSLPLVCRAQRSAGSRRWDTCAARHARGGRTGATPRTGSGEGQVAGLQVLVYALPAALAAEPGLLHPAEGGGRIRHDAAVQADHAGLEGLAHPEAPGQLLRED